MKFNDYPYEYGHKLRDFYINKNDLEIRYGKSII